MQKQVSKQSLAIVALSILLAICMALTATYAAFNVTKNVTGSITFVAPTLTIVANATDDAATALGNKLSITNSANNNVILTLTLGQEDFSFGGADAEHMTVALKSSIISALQGITFTVTGNGTNAFSVTTAATAQQQLGASGLLAWNAQNTESTTSPVTINFVNTAVNANPANGLFTIATIDEDDAGADVVGEEHDDPTLDVKGIQIAISFTINAQYITIA